MKPIFRFACAFLLLASSLCSAALPPKIIIQFASPLTQQESDYIGTQLDLIVQSNYSVSRQEARWILSVSPEISEVQFKNIMESIQTLDRVSFVEEDKILKANSLSSKIKTNQ